MAQRAPEYGELRISLAEDGWKDRVIADATRLSAIDRQAHALMTGAGGPPAFLHCDVKCLIPGAPVTGLVLARVPVGVTHAHVGLAASGRGTCRITSSQVQSTSIDSEGCLLTWSPPETGVQIPADGVGDVSSTFIDDAATDSARAIIVSPSGSPVLTWQTIELGIEVDAYYGETRDEARVWGVYLAWIHSALTAT